MSIEPRTEGSWNEKREYPRIKADCPIRYKLGAEDTWQVGTLLDYSATGALIKTEEMLFRGATLVIEVQPGCSKCVPVFIADAVVVRTSLDEDHNYRVGCQFKKPISTIVCDIAN